MIRGRNTCRMYERACSAFDLNGCIHVSSSAYTEWGRVM